MLEIVAGVVLLEGAHAVEDLPGGEDGLHAEDGAVEVAVAEQPEAAGVGAHVPADVAGALGAEVERDHEALLGEVVVEVLEDHSRLDRDH